MTMSKRERFRAQIAGKTVDRVPRVSGWIMGSPNLAELAGISLENYLTNPEEGVRRALLRLDVDAVVGPLIPREAEQIREGQLEQHNFDHITPEALAEAAERIPDTEEEVIAGVDLEATSAELKKHFTGIRALIGEAEIIPTIWQAAANFSLYFTYGYEAFLAATALYPEAVAKIYWADGIASRERNRVLLRCYEEFDLPPLLFCGDDICTGSGPMVNPTWLRENFWPHCAVALQPLVDAGIRILHHCDGNVMPLVDDMIEAGYTGFQGFQYEFGVDPFVLGQKLRDRGVRPLFLGGLSVTQTLPFGTAEDIRDEIDYTFDYSRGGCDLLLFTSNVTGVEVAPKKIQEAYTYAATKRMGATDGKISPPRPWPWHLKHPDGYFGGPQI